MHLHDRPRSVSTHHHTHANFISQNDRDHAGLANGTAAASEHLPRYFAKSGHVDEDPKKMKKNGGGKGGWSVLHPHISRVHLME